MNSHAQPTSGRNANVAPRRIIIAEDSEELRTLLATTLERSGFEVVQVRDGIELLSRLGVGAVDADAPYDLIVLDIRMPIVDGLYVLEMLRRMACETPVIAMTAFGAYGVLDQARQLGAIATFDKPFSLYALRDAALDIAGAQSRRRVAGRE